MRYYHADELNGKLEPFVNAATILSRYCRGFTARSKYGALVEAKKQTRCRSHVFLHAR